MLDPENASRIEIQRDLEKIHQKYPEGMIVSWMEPSKAEKIRNFLL